MQAADNTLDIVSHLGTNTLVLFALLANDQQTHLFFQLGKRIHQITVTLTLLRVANASFAGALTCRFQHHLALFQCQAVTLGIQICQLFHQVLATTQRQITTEIGTDRVARMIQHMQQGQRRAQAL